MAIPITVFGILTIAIPFIALIGFMDDSKVLALFPFMGAIFGGFVYTYLAADGNILVSGVTYTDYPFILLPLFLTMGDFALCAYKMAPSSKIMESTTLFMILGGIDAYFVPTLISAYATTANPSLPASMLPFVQNYGEIFTVGISVALFAWGMIEIWR